MAVIFRILYFTSIYSFLYFLSFVNKSPQIPLTNTLNNNKNEHPHTHPHQHTQYIYTLDMIRHNHIQDTHMWSPVQMLLYPFGSGAADAEMEMFVYEYNDKIKTAGEKMARVCEDLVFTSKSLGIFDVYYSPKEAKQRTLKLAEMAQTASAKHGDMKHNVAAAAVSVLGSIYSGDVITPLAYAANAAAYYTETLRAGHFVPLAGTDDNKSRWIYGEMRRACRKYETPVLIYEDEVLRVYYDVSPQLVLYLTLENLLSNIRIWTEEKNRKSNKGENCETRKKTLESITQKTEYYLDALAAQLLDNTDAHVAHCIHMYYPARCIQKHFTHKYLSMDDEATRAAAAFPAHGDTRNITQRVADEYLDIIRREMETERVFVRAQYDNYAETLRNKWAELINGYMTSTAWTAVNILVYPFTYMMSWGENGMRLLLALCVWKCVMMYVYVYKIENSQRREFAHRRSHRIKYTH